jgi:hypothetical protein
VGVEAAVDSASLGSDAIRDAALTERRLRRSVFANVHAHEDHIEEQPSAGHSRARAYHMSSLFMALF